MKTVNIHFAKTHLSKLVEEAMGGEAILIAKAGHPMVRLVPVHGMNGLRPAGSLAGQVSESPDCWDEDPALTALFYPAADAPPAMKVAEPGR
jgi:prevent-host-death family protein